MPHDRGLGKAASLTALLDGRGPTAGPSFRHDDVRLNRSPSFRPDADRPAEQYAVYELIGAPSGAAVRRDPASSLDETQKLLRRYPAVAAKVRRLWFDGFYTADYDQRIFSTLLSCHHLVAATVPWTALRHVGPDAWAALLTRHHPDFPDLGPTSTAPAGQCGEGISPAAGHGLTSLELMAIELTDSQKRLAASQLDLRPLRDGRVHFGTLRRLKLFGNTCHLPITDADLIAIAATATRLEEFHITALSTVSVQGATPYLLADDLFLGLGATD